MNWQLLITEICSTVAARCFEFSQRSHNFGNESLYESSYSTKTGAVYLASSVGGAPVHLSTLIKYDVDSWGQVLAITPNRYDGEKYSHKADLYAVYGIKVHQNTGNVWVTNSRQDTLAVYDGDDLSLIKQFPAGVSGHSSFRDLAFYGSNVYVGTEPGLIDVFDSSLYEFKGSIDLNTTDRFGHVMQTFIDEDSGVLYTVSFDPATAAAVDLKNNNKVTLYDLGEDVQESSGVAFDSKRQRLFVVSQGNKFVLVIDTKSGIIVEKLFTGAAGLNAVYDPFYDLVYYNSRTEGVTVVIDANTLEPIETLQSGINSNQVSLGPNGTIFVTVRNREPPNEFHAYTPKLLSGDDSTSKYHNPEPIIDIRKLVEEAADMAI